MLALRYIGNKILFLVLMSYPQLSSAEVVETPDINNWISTWKASPATPTIPRKIAVIQKWRDSGAEKGVAEFTNLEPADCETSSFLSCESHKDLNWTVIVNRANASNLSGVPGAKKLTDAEILVAPSSKKGWSVQIKDQKSQPAFNWKPDAAQGNAKAIMSALHVALGYEGIVLDQKGGYILIGSSTEVLTPDDIQGLILGGSEKTMAISKNSFKGTALISKVAFQNGFGIFKLVTTDGSTPSIPAGTKTIIEKTKQK